MTGIKERAILGPRGFGRLVYDAEEPWGLGKVWANGQPLVRPHFRYNKGKILKACGADGGHVCAAAGIQRVSSRGSRSLIDIAEYSLPLGLRHFVALARISHYDRAKPPFLCGGYCRDQYPCVI